MLEVLEQRWHLAATPVSERIVADPMTVSSFSVTSRGTLIVQGTTGDDIIHVTAVGGRVIANSNLMQGYEFSDVKRICIEGAAGDDRIAFEGDMNLPVTVLGGNGHDTLHGGGPRVTLSGGRGNDKLVAEGIFGVMLIGGRDNDRLFGGPGDDMLSGGAGNDYGRSVPDADIVTDIEQNLVILPAA